jgi:hypothetical protein
MKSETLFEISANIEPNLWCKMCHVSAASNPEQKPKERKKERKGTKTRTTTNERMEWKNERQSVRMGEQREEAAAKRELHSECSRQRCRNCRN